MEMDKAWLSVIAILLVFFPPSFCFFFLILFFSLYFVVSFFLILFFLLYFVVSFFLIFVFFLVFPCRTVSFFFVLDRAKKHKIRIKIHKNKVP